MEPRLLAFVGVAALLTIAPGPDMALVLRNALASGRSSVLPTSLGICSGLVVWGFASSLGIAAVIATSAQLFDALRLLGAVYLIFLGVRTLLDAARGTSGPAQPAASTRPSAGRSAFRQGLLSNLLNPKVGVFYTTFLPQFIGPGQPVFATSMLLTAIHVSMGLVWLVTYGRVASRLGDVIRRRRVRQAIETTSGGVLVAFGVALAIERR